MTDITNTPPANTPPANTPPANTPPAQSDSAAWIASIPEGPARDHVVAKGYKDPVALAVANYNLTRIHTGSGDVIERPRADAKPEEVANFYRTVNGVTADTKYDLKFADGLQVDQTYVETAKGWFKDAGLRPDQAQMLADKNNAWVQEQAAKMAEAGRAKNEADVAALKSKYETKGAGAYDQLVANGTKAAKALGLNAEFLGRLDAANGVAANLELLAVLGERMGAEASFHDGAPAGLTFANPESARVELARIGADKDFVDSLLNSKHAMHAVNTRKHADLQKVAYGKK